MCAERPHACNVDSLAINPWNPREQYAQAQNRSARGRGRGRPCNGCIRVAVERSLRPGRRAAAAGPCGLRWRVLRPDAAACTSLVSRAWLLRLWPASLQLLRLALSPGRRVVGRISADPPKADGA